jgi:hypothetical protein
MESLVREEGNNRENIFLFNYSRKFSRTQRAH